MTRDIFSSRCRTDSRDAAPEDGCGTNPARNHDPADADDRSRRQRCGPLPFLIRRDGVWLYRGSPIKRKPMVCLFASALRRAVDGTFWLRTPVEEGTIEVEDAPFLATELEWCGKGREQRLCFRTNVDEVVTAGRDHPLRAQWDVPLDACDSAKPPYITIRPGEGTLPVEARISRSVWYELAALAVPGCYGSRACLGVWSCGVFFPLALAPRGCAEGCPDDESSETDEDV